MAKARRWRVEGVKLGLEQEESPEALVKAVARALGTSAEAVGEVAVIKRSFDARKHTAGFVYLLDAQVWGAVRPRGVKVGEVPEVAVAPPPKRLRDPGARVAVVGAGPAGLFAALALARAGLKPILLDRGKAVEGRGKDVGALINRAVLDPESNLCFGEGGAGTWSDGKLTTRIGAGGAREVLEILHEMGAPARILTDGKPHLGTDRLVKILRALRAALIDAGAEVLFSARVDGIDMEGGQVKGLRLSDGAKVAADRVVLAVGHSSGEMYEHLLASGVQLEAKPMAMGFRVEHPQALINQIQYGSFAEHPSVPTADYRLTAQHGARGIYSFCMCPGGQIMPTATRPDTVIVNGMSNASRSGRWANAALVVTVSPEDYARYGDGPLAGARMQLAIEQAAATLGGGQFRAPAQSVPDFLAGRASTDLRKTSYRPGVTPSDLRDLFPAPITDALRVALRDFERRMPGFITADAILHGVETRTSAPVRILRGDDLQSVSVKGLYPAGEGAGYAGGIVSAAVDGLKVARRILDELSE
jgi:uncharacterized protein